MSNRDDDRRQQMQREQRVLRWMLAAAAVWAAFELTRLADRVAVLISPTP